jgi:apolipoprotein N-acyltransferase
MDTGSLGRIDTRSSALQLQDRFVWLWLLAGGLLLPFSRFQTVLPLAAWFAPVFLLRFSRSRRAACPGPGLLPGNPGGLA